MSVQRAWAKIACTVTPGIEHSALSSPGTGSLPGSAAFVVAVTLVALAGGIPAVAIYALSFWHYYLYWLAYRYGAVAHGAFLREAVAMKTVAVLAFAVVYLAAPLDVLSVTVMAAGFTLNGLAARVLGVDRTYYGAEVAGLRRQPVTAFPYSCMAHPMLFGNVLGYAGTLINADFRQHWWPLASLHVAMNLALLFMELNVRPQRLAGQRDQGRQPATGLGLLAAPGLVAAGTGSVGIGAAAYLWATGGNGALVLAFVGASALAHATVIYFCYSCPAPAAMAGRQSMEERPR